MKKIVAVIVIFVCVGAALSAQINMSAGGGVQMGFNAFIGDFKDLDMNQFQLGLHAFFDLTYGEIAAYFDLGMGNDYTSTGLSFTALGKFPIQMGAMTVFPLAGIGLNVWPLSLSTKVGGTKIKISGDITETSIFVPVGGGLDMDLFGNFYLRGAFLFNLGFRWFDDWGDDPPGAFAYVKPMLRASIGYKF